ncbi:uncharacterized protein I206_103487 [Kwoniella pini CBS 10737]|uniref:Uncharacterized protein n=1 Tax=Kwoniella pini CBS 10737 TaxID=1296096 RepID=A0A1B9I9P8_9TREE|nr:uncharacterized protein I206_01509 [Kwoniella pini CBS 10737]OCF52223.1 hypothetical protein I206_01509 [Kwoniella pini CBS 10737]
MVSLLWTPSSPTTTPKLISRTFSQKRNLCFLVISLFILSFLVLGLHPNVQQNSIEQYDRLKEWSNDKAQNLAEGLSDDTVLGGTLKGWLDHSEKVEEKECKGWNHVLGEENDPPNCLKARQYRQTMRALEREEKAEHPHWYFTLQHNLETLRNISSCFLPVTDPDWRLCHEKPLILSGWWYTAEVITGATTGEVIWQSSIVKQLKMLGYSFIAVGPYLNWVEVAEMMPDVYHLIWNSDVDTVTCITDPRCIAKEHYVPPEDAEDLSIDVPDEERGVIPIWALAIVDYWGARPREMSNNAYWWGLTEDGPWSYHPLGQEWIATPWPLPGGHFHLPYSVEDYCLKMPIKPHEDRKNAALILAKRSSYFHYPQVSPPQFWTNLSQVPDFDLLSTVEEEEGKPIPDGLVTMGKQSKEDYTALVGSVKALVGMGAPPISPSIYISLCQATPVVIPYFQQDYRMDGWWLYSSWSQHGPAIALGEPYVYKYYSQNYTDLEDAIRRAMSTSIERYIPENMKLPYTLSQLSKYLSRDLKLMFKDVIDNNGGKIPKLKKGTRERCYKLNRCKEPLKIGRIPNIPSKFSSKAKAERL